MPCVSRFLNGSSPCTSPSSRISLWKKRAYSRCRIACSMPPMYWSTGSQCCAACLVHHAGSALRAGVARVIPGRFDEGIHGVGFAPGLAAALRAGAFVEFRHLRQRRTRAVRHHVLRQYHRQLFVRHRHVAASRAMDDGDRAAPVALARDAPVAQAELHFLFAQAFGGEVGGDGVNGLLRNSGRRICRS